MKTTYHHKIARGVVIVSLAFIMGGCLLGDRLSSVGAGAAFSPVTNPATQANYQRVSLPMPKPVPQISESNSLWLSGSRAFFRDQRARVIGDILTVIININDNATMNNTTTRNRGENSETAAIPEALGLNAAARAMRRVLPGSTLTEVAGLTSTSKTSGTGNIKRTERVQLRVAAVVSDVLPNGNFFIHGRQEVKVNYEVRDLEIAGVIRPEDITNTNTINLAQIAEARVAYGGRGFISDAQQPRYGQHIYDILYPF